MKICITFGCIFTGLIYANSVFSADFESQFILPFTAQYESNPTLSSTEERSIYRRIFEPRLIAEITDERNIWRADLAYRIERSSQTDISDDRDDPYIGLEWGHEFENSRLVINAVSEENSTRDTELEDSGLISSDGTRQAKRMAVFWDQELSEILSFLLNLEHNEINYNNVGLTDYIAKTANARFNYNYSDRLAPFIGFGRTEYEEEGNSASDLRFANLGIGWGASEGVTITASAGQNKVNFENEEVSETQGALRVDYTAEKTTLSVTATRMVSPSGLGGFVKYNQLTAEWRYGLTELSNLDVNLIFRENIDADENINTNENKAGYASITYNKDMGEDWRVSFTGARRSTQTLTDEASSDIFAVTLSYTL